MNQCDGCRAGRPLVRFVKQGTQTGWIVDPNGDTHIMGYHVDPSYKGLIQSQGKYPDLLSCQRKKYEESDEVSEV